MKTVINTTNEIQEQDFYVETTVINTIVRKVRASSFEEAKSMIDRDLVKAEDVVDANTYKVTEDVTENYVTIFKTIEESLGGN